MIAGFLNILGAGLITMLFVWLLLRKIGAGRIEEFISSWHLSLQVLLWLLCLQLFLEAYSLELFQTFITAAFGALYWFFSFMLHEAGHIYWRVFGETFSALGGTLNETIIPIGLALFCLWRAYFRVAGLSLWFLSLNLQGISRYMSSALDMKHAEVPMHGTHDWKYLFDTFSISTEATWIAACAWNIGLGFGVLSLLILSIGICCSRFKFRHQG